MDGLNALTSTPTKISSIAGCVLCGSEEKDSRNKTKLNGKVSDLQERICSILDIPLSSISVDGYICNDRCYRQVKRLEKLQEDAKTLHRSNEAQSAFRLGNFTKCFRAGESSSPHRRWRESKGRKKSIISRNIAKTKSGGCCSSSFTNSTANSPSSFACNWKFHFRWPLRGKYLYSTGN